MKRTNKSETRNSLVNVNLKSDERIPKLLLLPPSSEETRIEKTPAAKTSKIAASSAIPDIAKTLDLKIGSCNQR